MHQLVSCPCQLLKCNVLFFFDNGHRHSTEPKVISDAFVIADYLRVGRMPMTVVKEEQYVALQQLTRARYQLVRQITQEKQRFLQYLSYKCNTFTEEVDSSVFGKAMMDLFFEQYSLDE